MTKGENFTLKDGKSLLGIFDNWGTKSQVEDKEELTATLTIFLKNLGLGFGLGYREFKDVSKEQEDESLKELKDNLITSAIEQRNRNQYIVVYI